MKQIVQSWLPHAEKTISMRRSFAADVVFSFLSFLYNFFFVCNYLLTSIYI